MNVKQYININKAIGYLLITIALQTCSSPPEPAKPTFWKKLHAWTGDPYMRLGVDAKGIIYALSLEYLARSTDHGNTWEGIGSDSASHPVSMYGFLIAPSGYMLIGSSARGIYKSTDGGISWYLSNTGIEEKYKSVYALAISPNGHIFAGSHGGGIFRSTNNGDSWIRMVIGLKDTVINSLIVNSKGEVFTSTPNGGIFRSTDEGNLWFQVNSTKRIGNMAINHKGFIFADVNYSNFLKSTDDGLSWTQGSINARCIVIWKNDKIFAGSYGEGIYHSTDDGIRWENISSGLDLGSGIYKDNIISLAIDSSGYVYAGTVTSGLYRSSAPLSR